jgi:hypothetical protein
MRRILAIALLIAFCSPLVVPVLASTADPQALLPACCRRNGAHHCFGMGSAAASDGLALNAPACPVYPAPSTPLRLATAVPCAPHAPSAALLRAPAPPALSRPYAYSSIPSANPKRGPPALLA